jgi:hypothetical protein
MPRRLFPLVSALSASVRRLTPVASHKSELPGARTAFPQFRPMINDHEKVRFKCRNTDAIGRI